MTQATPYQADLRLPLRRRSCSRRWLWTAVYVELRRYAELRRARTLVLVFLLANPMLAFVTASVNTDALVDPAVHRRRASAAGACSRLVTGSLRTSVWLAAAALVKPAGLQMIVARRRRVGA